MTSYHHKSVKQVKLPKHWNLNRIPGLWDFRGKVKRYRGEEQGGEELLYVRPSGLKNEDMNSIV